MAKKEKRKYRVLRRISRVLGTLFLLFLLLIILVRSPWGQDIIVSKIVDYVSDKTNTKIEIDRLFITFSGNIFLEGLYLEDKKGDTLVYSKFLEADIGWSPLIFNNTLNLEYAKWEGLTANIARDGGSERFNFDFLVVALAPNDTATTKSNSEPLQINVESLFFKNFDISYQDRFLGIQTLVTMGKFRWEANNTDLDSLRFDLDYAELTDTDIFYTQNKPFNNAESTAAQLPYFSVENLQLNNVRAGYHSSLDSITADVDIGSFLLELPKADLTRNTIEIDLLSLKNSAFVVQLPKQTTEMATVPSTTSSFDWPKYVVKTNAVVFENNSLRYNSGKTRSNEGGFNPDALSFSSITLKANNLGYHPKNLHVELDRFSFLERSGLGIQNLAFNAAITDRNLSLSGLQLRTQVSSLVGSLSVEYPSVKKFMDAPENSILNLQIPDLQFSLRDAFLLQPKLSENEYLTKVAEKTFSGNIKAKGTLGAVKIKEMNLGWGRNTNLMAAGSVLNIIKPEALGFDFNTLKIKTDREDLLKFVSENELGIRVPQTVLVIAKAKGNLNEMDADARLEIPEGSVSLKGNYRNEYETMFVGNIRVDSLQLNKLLANEKLGAVSFSAAVEGSGKSLNTLNAALKSDFNQLTLMDYDFSNLQLQANIKNGKGNIDLDFKDTNLNLEASSNLNLNETASDIQLDVNIVGADLYALGVTKDEIKAGLRMSANFKGNMDDFELRANLENGIAVFDNQQYQMGTIDVLANIDAIGTNLQIESDFLQGGLTSNATPNKINEILTQHFENYFRDSSNVASRSDSTKLKMDMRLLPVPILTDVFFRDIERLDSIAAFAEFDGLTQILNAELHVPSAKYADISIDSLNVSIAGDGTNLNFTAGLSNLAADPVQIKKTYVEGALQDKRLLVDFNSYDAKERVAHIASKIHMAKDTVLWHIIPSELTLNRKEWSVPEDNQILIGKDFLAFSNVKLHRNAQELVISNTVSGVEKEHIGIRFDNFKLQTFASLLNPNEALTTGLVAGDFVIENPFGATGLIADFKINSLEVLKNSLGNLTLKAVSDRNASYDFNLALKGGGADLDLTGDYAAASSGAKLNLDLDLKRMDVEFIQGFSGGILKEGSGYLSGRIAVSGTTTSPEYNGTINFKAVRFNAAQLNAVFKIPEESLKIDTEGLYLDTFKIVDADGSNFTLNGSILTESWLNPSFDLTLDAEKFKILNSTKEDNEFFYGIASLDAAISVKGELELPRIKGRLRIRDVTDITYIVPESQLEVEERDGVVIFVNRENPDAILTRNDQEETRAFFQGMDVEALLEIAKDADFRIVIDERTGDNLEVSGDAALNLSIEPSGRIDLSGRYELNSGHYETSLYNLVNRRFEINPGSTITWQGNPTDAKLDVTAVYKLETSAAPLMSTVTSGQDISVAGQYRQVLPFLVYLNVDGELLKPQLSFGLDMPEEEQGSLGGAVYGRVRQLNQQEAELNKQVFSLLALNRFYPDSGSDGSGGGTAAIARNNVNKVLSGELNAFSDKVFGNTGFQVDFDLDSFTDYQGESPEDRTQLNINAKKKLFDDRLIVTAGSAVDVEGSAQPGQEQTPLIGNVSLEYLLTKDGRYRLRGFRRSEYENIIDGQLILTGVALIFNREFNTFSQLFNPLKKSQEEKQKSAKEKEQNIIKD